MKPKNYQESKRDRFIRIAENRTNRILETLRLLENCANTGTYEYSQKDVEKIFSAIQTQLNDTKKAFSKSGSTSKNNFTLK